MTPQNVEIEEIGTDKKIIIRRVFSRASKATFTIPPIKELVNKYVKNDGKGWIDPFSGDNSPAEYTNDLNPEKPTKYHMDAVEFCKLLSNLNIICIGGLFDPPYSYRQVTEHYAEAGIKATSMDTSYNFYNRVMTVLAPMIPIGGYALSFGWNSNGFGKSKGFEIVEILVVAHGLHHNDTICTVERKVRK
jgi:hypothetical protein